MARQITTHVWPRALIVRMPVDAVWPLTAAGADQPG